MTNTHSTPLRIHRTSSPGCHGLGNIQFSSLPPPLRISENTRARTNAPDIIAHAHAVAEYAREIAERYNEMHRNHADVELVIVGALLQYIGRACSNGIDHAVAGAEIA